MSTDPEFTGRKLVRLIVDLEAVMGNNNAGLTPLAKQITQLLERAVEEDKKLHDRKMMGIVKETLFLNDRDLLGLPELRRAIRELIAHRAVVEFGKVEAHVLGGRCEASIAPTGEIICDRCQLDIPQGATIPDCPVTDRKAGL